jgi:hypothetical protein
MAYVRKTETLIDDIVRNVRDMKDKALSAYQSNTIERGTPEFDSALEAIQVAAFRAAPHLRQSYPDSWMKRCRYRINLKFLNADDTFNFNTMLDVDGLDVKVPAHMDSGYSSVDAEVRREECPEVLKAWLDGASDRNKQRQQVAEQFSTVETQLVAYMRGHASLNAAITDMPEIEMYVPAKYMEKLREPTAPRAKKPQQMSLVDELSIDRDALAAIAIANRITT